MANLPKQVGPRSHADSWPPQEIRQVAPGQWPQEGSHVIHVIPKGFGKGKWSLIEELTQELTQEYKPSPVDRELARVVAGVGKRATSPTEQKAPTCEVKKGDLVLPTTNHCVPNVDSQGTEVIGIDSRGREYVSGMYQCFGAELPMYYVDTQDGWVYVQAAPHVGTELVYRLNPKTFAQFVVVNEECTKEDEPKPTPPPSPSTQVAKRPTAKQTQRAVLAVIEEEEKLDQEVEEIVNRIKNIVWRKFKVKGEIDPVIIDFLKSDPEYRAKLRRQLDAMEWLRSKPDPAGSDSQNSSWKLTQKAF